MFDKDTHKSQQSMQQGEKHSEDCFTPIWVQSSKMEITNKEIRERTVTCILAKLEKEEDILVKCSIYQHQRKRLISW